MNKITRKPYNYGNVRYLINGVCLRRANSIFYKAFRDYNKKRINYIEFRRRMKYGRSIYEKNK